jgi:hypothetical protein
MLPAAYQYGDDEFPPIDPLQQRRAASVWEGSDLADNNGSRRPQQAQQWIDNTVRAYRSPLNWLRRAVCSPSSLNISVSESSKGILTWAASSLLVGVVICLCTAAYNTLTSNWREIVGYLVMWLLASWSKGIVADAAQESCAQRRRLHANALLKLCRITTIMCLGAVAVYGASKMLNRADELVEAGGHVKLTPNFHEYASARHGPLREGQEGLVVGIDVDATSWQVQASDRTWWYDKRAIVSASESSPLLRPPVFSTALAILASQAGTQTSSLTCRQGGSRLFRRA